MPGCERVKGNERAESLASKPAVADGRARDLTGILNIIRDAGWAGFSGCELYTTALVQLLEMGTARRAAKNIRYMGS